MSPGFLYSVCLFSLVYTSHIFHVELMIQSPPSPLTEASVPFFTLLCRWGRDIEEAGGFAPSLTFGEGEGGSRARAGFLIDAPIYCSLPILLQNFFDMASVVSLIGEHAVSLSDMVRITFYTVRTLS
jgi:hypothetical protein